MPSLIKDEHNKNIEAFEQEFTYSISASQKQDETLLLGKVESLNYVKDQVTTSNFGAK